MRSGLFIMVAWQGERRSGGGRQVELASSCLRSGLFTMDGIARRTAIWNVLLSLALAMRIAIWILIRATNDHELAVHFTLTFNNGDL